MSAAPKAGESSSRKSLIAGADTVRCDVCHTDVSFSLFLRCGADYGLDLCPDCFVGAAGSSGGYMVANALQFEARPGSSWSAREELRLLKAISTCGFGNWDSIHLLVRSRSASACREHSFRYLAPAFEGADLRPEAAADGDHSLRQASGAACGKRERVSLGDSDFVARTGFMALRGDFDVEYNDDAEAAVADLDFGEDDSGAERTMKLHLLRRYNCKLKERYRWKDFFLEYGSSSVRSLNRANGEVRSIMRALRPFSRFTSAAEHESLLSDLVTARLLRRRIAELHSYREMGMHTMRHVELAEAVKKRARRR